MAEKKVAYFWMDEEKDVCFPTVEEEEEFVLRRADMAVFEIWGCCRVPYHARLLPEFLWWAFSAFPPYCLNIAFEYFVTIPLHLDRVICTLVAFLYITLQCIVLLYPMLNNYRYPFRTPIRSVGPRGKFMIDFVPALTAAALHHRLNLNNHDGLLHFLEFNYGHLFLLLGCTTYFYVIIHFMRSAYDIGGKDVILGLAMQTFCFMVNGGLLVRAVAFIFCFGISFYRYMTYSDPPASPPRPKMESDRLPY